MKCPVCRKEMSSRPVDGDAIEVCRQCKGVWFHPGAFDFVKDEIDPDLRWFDSDFWKKAGEFQATVTTLKCPRDGQTDLQALYFEKADVGMAFCPACEGIWLQEANFSKIIRSLTKEAETMAVSDYVKASLKEAADLVSHPEKLPSEWRDLKAVFRLMRYRFFIENPKVKNLVLGIQKSLPL